MKIIILSAFCVFVISKNVETCSGSIKMHIDYEPRNVKIVFENIINGKWGKWKCSLVILVKYIGFHPNVILYSIWTGGLRAIVIIVWLIYNI